MMTTLFSYQEIIRHRSVDDIWIISKNKVYDVTSFLELNPQHTERIMKKAGTDVTTDFKFHSTHQQKEWKKYQIGIVKNMENTICTIM